MIISRIAFRNLFRQRRRSLLTMLTMAVGFLLCSLSLGIALGTYGSLIDMFTRDHTGHIQVHKRGYLDKPSLYDTFGGLELLGRKISSVPGVEAWTPRVLSPALAALGKKTSGARVVGVEPLREAETTRLMGKVSSGRFLSPDPSGEVMLGRGLAEVLRADIGDEIVLITQAADGSIANDLYTVVGLVGSGDDTFGQMTCYMHLAAAQEFLVLPGRVHEVAIVVTDQSEAVAVADRMKELLDDPALEVSPWQIVERWFYEAMQADIQGMWVSLGIIMAIVGIGVLNTVLMSILERTREFGVLRALGTRPTTLIKLVLLETAYLSIIGIMVGSAVSLLGNFLLSEYGISYPTPIDYGGVRFERMVGKVSFEVFWIPAVVTFGTAMIVSLFPALRAARITPARAMRTH